MTPTLDAAAATDAVQDLAQFEPDPDGDGSVLAVDPGVDDADDPQWIVWPDAVDESMWAAVELTQIGAGWDV